MRNRIIYGIIKTYKGIFSKTHIGNIQIFIIEMNSKFWILNVLGQMDDETHASQLILSAPSQYINAYLQNLEEEQDFIPLEEIFCTIPKESEDEFKVLIKKKGKYLSSNYTISFSTEYSDGNIRIYIIDGVFNPLIPDNFKNKAQLKMSALKQQALARPIINKFTDSLKQ